MNPRAYSRLGWMMCLGLIGCGALLDASPQQAPPEKLSCKPTETLVGRKCVPKQPIDGQAVAETPPASHEHTHPTIPRCKEHEVLKDGHCVPDDGN
jgi:hypothetical protein